jgi:uncharacterized protein YndB with AHSA1/START domain
VIVRDTVRVAAPPSAAFELFTTGIGRWWPLDRFSYGAERAGDIFLEARTGGRFYERFVDGDQLQVGEVLDCDPPDRILFTWQAPGWPHPTEVEVTFTADDGGTCVEVEHRAFERLGPDGDAIGKGFAGGWPTVLALFAAASDSGDEREG